MQKRAPTAARSAQMRPPCSLTMPSEIERPSPVPCPVGFVVKNGLKMTSSDSGGIPGPVSSTSTRTASCIVRVRIVRRWLPRSTLAIACSALVMRLSRTCWSW